jgi:hypothetical protein
VRRFRDDPPLVARQALEDQRVHGPAVDRHAGTAALPTGRGFKAVRTTARELGDHPSCFLGAILTRIGSSAATATVASYSGSGVKEGGLGSRRRSRSASLGMPASIRSVTSRMSRSVSACLMWSWRNSSRSSSKLSSSNIGLHRLTGDRRRSVTGSAGAMPHSALQCPH